MFDDLKSALGRSASTLAGDIAGGSALVVLVLVALHLPGAL
jgi:hypothetical protein